MIDGKIVSIRPFRSFKVLPELAQKWAHVSTWVYQCLSPNSLITFWYKDMHENGGGDLRTTSPERSAPQSFTLTLDTDI